MKKLVVFNNNNQRAKQILEVGLFGRIRSIKRIVTWHRNQEHYLKDDWTGCDNYEY